MSSAVRRQRPPGPGRDEIDSLRSSIEREQVRLGAAHARRLGIIEGKGASREAARSLLRMRQLLARGEAPTSRSISVSRRCIESDGKL